VFLPDGSLGGSNRIEVVAGGCALLEQWLEAEDRASPRGFEDLPLFAAAPRPT
jgi:hypothetical protein